MNLLIKRLMLGIFLKAVFFFETAAIIKRSVCFFVSYYTMISLKEISIIFVYEHFSSLFLALRFARIKEN